VSIKGELLQIAKTEVANAKGRANQFRAEYLEAEKALAELKMKLDFEDFADDRLANYQVILGPDYQCPRCWITSELESPLRPALSDSGESLLRCNHGHDLPIG
jgi:hypothetical protein